MNNLINNKNMILIHSKMIRNKKERMKKLKKNIMKEKMRRSRHLKRNSNLRKVFRRR